VTKYRITHGQSIIEFPSQDLAQAYLTANNIQSSIESFNETIPIQSMLDTLEKTSVKYITFGKNLSDTLKQKMWAYNTLLSSTGNGLTTSQLAQLLSLTDGLVKSLETGSLLTAKDGLNYLKSVMPQYTNIVDYALSEIQRILS
jgi:hypothetical protein